MRNRGGSQSGFLLRRERDAKPDDEVKNGDGKPGRREEHKKYQRNAQNNRVDFEIFAQSLHKSEQDFALPDAVKTPVT